MTALLYHSIVSCLTEDEIIETDVQAAENRKVLYFFVIKFPSNSKKHVKKWVLQGMMMLHLSQPLIPCINAIMLPVPSVGANHRLILELNKILNDENYYPQIVTLLEEKIDKLQLTTDQFQELNDFANQINEGSITTDQVILQLRGGDWTKDLGQVIGLILVVRFGIWANSLLPAEAFPLPANQNYRGWVSKPHFPANDNYRTSSSHHQMRKPATISQDEYSALSKADKRRLPDPRDSIIEIPNRPKLEIRYNQVQHKVKKHGADHGLDINEFGNTPKTEANILAFRNSIVEIANDPKTLWYSNGQYQGGTPRSCQSINLYNKDKELIIIFEKQPDGSHLFLTTFTLNDVESKHLAKSNGNCLTQSAMENINQTAGSINLSNNFSLNKTPEQQNTTLPINTPINIEQTKNDL